VLLTDDNPNNDEEHAQGEHKKAVAKSGAIVDGPSSSMTGKRKAAVQGRTRPAPSTGAIKKGCESRFFWRKWTSSSANASSF
jgi:hypothetical protein